MERQQTLKKFEDNLRESFTYDPNSGKIYWKDRYNGREAYTSYQTGGYKQGGAFGKFVTAHRVAWFLYYGEWPTAYIDHINGVKDDNRICNLRDVSAKDNSKNQKKAKRNTSGVTGVVWHKNVKRWVVRVGDNHVGTFTCFVEAVFARRKAEAEHGYSKDHGKRR